MGGILESRRIYLNSRPLEELPAMKDLEKILHASKILSEYRNYFNGNFMHRRSL